VAERKTEVFSADGAAPREPKLNLQMRGTEGQELGMPNMRTKRAVLEWCHLLHVLDEFSQGRLSS
jgi:hypothetical protein